MTCHKNFKKLCKTWENTTKKLRDEYLSTIVIYRDLGICQRLTIPSPPPKSNPHVEQLTIKALILPRIAFISHNTFFDSQHQDMK